MVFLPFRRIGGFVLVLLSSRSRCQDGKELWLSRNGHRRYEVSNYDVCRTAGASARSDMLSALDGLTCKPSSGPFLSCSKEYYGNPPCCKYRRPLPVFCRYLTSNLRRINLTVLQRNDPFWLETGRLAVGRSFFFCRFVFFVGGPCPAGPLPAGALPGPSPQFYRVAAVNYGAGANGTPKSSSLAQFSGRSQ